MQIQGTGQRHLSETAARDTPPPETALHKYFSTDIKLEFELDTEFCKNIKIFYPWET